MTGQDYMGHWTGLHEHVRKDEDGGLSTPGLQPVLAGMRSCRLGLGLRLGLAIELELGLGLRLGLVLGFSG